MGKEDAYCELSFSPNVSLIATVRRFVGEFYQRVLADDEVASRLVVATHELLENAVRYSCDGRSSIRIGVGRQGDNLDVAIVTKNRTTEEHRRLLGELLDEMHASTDRGGFYQTLLRRTAKREIGSGLGLGRIYAESEMDLTCSIEMDEVHLSANGSFPALKAASGGGR
jgi:anti-sigma regulatory factor (Ser/Thr protein kinase)